MIEKETGRFTVDKSHNHKKHNHNDTGHNHSHDCHCGHDHEECCHESSCHCNHHHEESCHESSCHCGHDHNHKSSAFDYIMISISAVLLLVSFIPAIWQQRTVFYIVLAVSSLMSGYKTYLKGFKEIRKFEIGEHFLLLIAVISAFCIGECREGAAVSLFFAIGEIFEGLANKKSEKSLRKLSEIKTDKANVLKDGMDYETVDVSEIRVGDKIVVLPFERVPVDCCVIEGSSYVDTSAVTGESLPVETYEGREIYSGSLNGEGRFVAQVLKSAEESVAARIVELAKNNAKTKSKSEKLITRFAKYYTPIVIVLGILIATIPALITGEWTKWIKSGLVFIVASCPCALVISVPLSFFSGIGLASKNAIIIKGGKYIENLSKASVVCFDKTGTLTDGKLKVSKFETFNGFDEETVRRYAFDSEKSSVHPLAVAIKSFCEKSEDIIEELKEYPGQGTKIKVMGNEILCGSKRFMELNEIKVEGLYNVYLSVNGVLAGAFKIESSIREDSIQAIEEMRKSGIKKLYMLTGDSNESAEYVSDKCNLDGYFSELLPEDKTDILKKLQNENGKTVYVGDGINDAPVIATSDVGVAMGLGSDVAIETADMVLMSEKIGDLNKAIKISKLTMKTVYSNIIFALGIKLVVLILALFGLSFMAIAVFADVGVSIIAIINSSRILAKKIK